MPVDVLLFLKKNWRVAWVFFVEIDHFALVEALCCFKNRIGNWEFYLEFYGQKSNAIVFHPIM